MYKIEFMKCKLVKERNCTYTRIQTPADAVDILIDLGLHEASEEYVYLLCLNCRGRITAVHEVAHGSLSECPMSTKAVFSRALLNGSASIIVAHNHPSSCRVKGPANDLAGLFLAKKRPPLTRQSRVGLFGAINHF